METRDLGEIRHEDFAPCTGDAFEASAGSGSEAEVSLRLIECTELKHKHPGAVREPFSLRFSGPADRPLGQGTYLLKHSQLGELEMFLVPIGRDPDGFIYEAVFT